MLKVKFMWLQKMFKKLLYNLILFFVRFWQKTRVLRSLFKFSQCRFYPSCSDYFLESLKIHGLIYGSMLSLKRFFRCNPLFEGGIDEMRHYGH